MHKKQVEEADASRCESTPCVNVNITALTQSLLTIPLAIVPRC